MRVRQALAIRLNDVTEVSIHALMRVRLLQEYSMPGQYKFQSTHS